VTESDQGGLVPLVIHHVSATNTGNDSNWISLDEFTQFVEWLAQRPAATQVKTMREVIGGNEQAYVNGPPLPTQSPNLVQNYSLENVTSGVPPASNWVPRATPPTRTPAPTRSGWKSPPTPPVTASWS
jgi:hypothetical protein